MRNMSSICFESFMKNACISTVDIQINKNVHFIRDASVEKLSLF